MSNMQSDNLLKMLMSMKGPDMKLTDNPYVHMPQSSQKGGANEAKPDPSGKFTGMGPVGKDGLPSMQFKPVNGLGSK